MKIAEALQERADLNKRIEQLRWRLERNATVQEGERPAEDPAELIEELDASLERLEKLTACINLTNAAAKPEGAEDITRLIAKRDALMTKLSVYRDLVSEASNITSRATRSEIKILSTVDVRRLQKKIDDMSRNLRETENRIQSANWTIELVEDIEGRRLVFAEPAKKSRAKKPAKE